MLSEANAEAIKPRGVNRYLKLPYAILLALTAFIAMAVCEAVGITLWPVPVAMVAVAGYALYNVEWAFPGLSNSGTRKTFGVLAPVMLLIGLAVSSGADDRERAQRIIELAKSNPIESRRLLDAADEGVLSSLKTLDPSLEAAERNRRAAVAVDQGNRQRKRLAMEAEAQEKANAGKIRSIEEQLRKTPDDDVAARIGAYKKLTTLAPSNTVFAQKLAEAETLLAKRERMESHPDEFLELDVKWYKGGFGSIMMLRGAIKNKSLVDLKDFTVRCEHSGPSGTVMDSNTRVIYERVNAGQTKRIAEVNMGFIDPQASNSSCEITNAENA